MADSERVTMRGPEPAGAGRSGEQESDAVNHAAEQAGVNPSGCEAAAPDQSTVTFLPGVKHPYLGVVTVDGTHLIIVMQDASPSLDQVLVVGTLHF